MDATCRICGRGGLDRGETTCCVVIDKYELRKLRASAERCERLEAALQRAKRTLEYYATPSKSGGREIGNLSYRAKAGVKLIDAALEGPK